MEMAAHFLFLYSVYMKCRKQRNLCGKSKNASKNRKVIPYPEQEDHQYGAFRGKESEEGIYHTSGRQ